MTTQPAKLKNLRDQTLLFRCLETGFVTAAPALTRYQQGRAIDPNRRELVGERPGDWIEASPSTTCEPFQSRDVWKELGVEAASVIHSEGGGREGSSVTSYLPWTLVS